MSVESKIKREFELLAAEVSPRRHGWAEVETRIRRDHSKRMVGSAVAAVAAAVVAVAVVTVVRPGPPGRDGLIAPRPGVSSNGKIAFVRADPRTVEEGRAPVSALYVVDPDGSGLTKLADGVIYRSTPSWAPNGSGIAFEKDSDILLAGADGSAVRILIDCDPRVCSSHHPAWSPDGSRIAFLRRLTGNRDGLYSIRLHDREPSVLRDDFAGISDITWSPDGKQIALTGSREDTLGGRTAIFVVDAASGAILGTIAPAGIEPGDTLAWSPDGTRIAFNASGDGGTCTGAGIYLVRPDGSGLTPLTARPGAESGCMDVYPAWSPDGKEIVFTRARSEFGSDGFTGDLFVADVESARVRRLTSGADLDCCPSWQPIPR